jgi:BASS family bile acid:Na+ symporter
MTLPFLLGAQADLRISVREVLEPVVIVMFVPLILARLVSYMPLGPRRFLRAGKRFSFAIWLLNLFLISANASSFLRHENQNSISTLLVIALISLVLCIVNFGLGALLGGRQNWQEASQSLGQKNLSFVIWIALTFINPLVAMGPTFYILFHHLYNSWSIYRFEKRRNS